MYGLVIPQLVHGVLLMDAARANAMIQSLYVFAFEAVIVSVALTIRFARRWCARGARWGAASSMREVQPVSMLRWGVGMLSHLAAGLAGSNALQAFKGRGARGRRYKAHREPVQVASQAALTAAACCLLARPLAATLPAAGARSMFWFARCVFAEMLGSHAIMFVVRGARLASACPRLHTHVWPACPPSAVAGDHFLRVLPEAGSLCLACPNFCHAQAAAASAVPCLLHAACRNCVSVALSAFVR